MNYEEIQTIVNDLLPQFGVKCKAITEKISDYVPGQGQDIEEVETFGNVVITNIDMRFGNQNNLIEVGDQTLLATTSLALEVDSICIVGDVKYKVIAPNPIKPADTIVMYKAHVRRV